MTNWRDLDPIPVEDQPDLPEDWTPSQTLLRYHDRCDRSALLHLQHRGGASTHPLNRGSIFHLTVERLLRLMIEQGEGTVPPEIGRDVLYEVMAENAELQVSADERDTLRYLVHHWCRGTAWEPERIIGIEKTLSLETGGFRVQVRPDVILDLGGGVCEIKDHKTAWPPDSEEFRAQAYDAEGNPRFAGNYQLCFSAVVAAFGITDDGLPLGNFDRFILSLEYPRILREDGIDKRVVEVDRLQVQSFRDDLDLQLRRLREVCIEKRKWAATAGNHCKECPCAQQCPLPRVLRPESQNANLDSIADLEKVGTTWNFMSASAQRLKKRLKTAAETFSDEDLLLGHNDDGEPILGVRIGKDIALVFTSTEKELIPDKQNLRAAAEAAANLGEKFDWEEHVKKTTGVSLEKRRIFLDG